jgi:hypothetical protein
VKRKKQKARKKKELISTLNEEQFKYLAMTEQIKVKRKKKLKAD